MQGFNAHIFYVFHTSGVTAIALARVVSMPEVRDHENDDGMLNKVIFIYVQ